MTEANSRTSEHPVDPVFLERWSPRAFDGKPVPLNDLLSMFEAARWAPSTYNSQPWRFVFAIKGTPHFDKFLGLLLEFNQSWAKEAGALVIGISKKTFLPPGKTEPQLSHTHSLDTGAAWGYFALEAHKLGYYTHGMGGFDVPRAATELEVSDDYRVELAVAIGRIGDKANLPESLRAREMPSSRQPVGQFAFEGALRG